MPSERFSASQLAAVTHFGSDVSVRAGAGSGKTSVLVGRFVRAVMEGGVEPGRILAITFTERAANEMKQRLVKEFSGRGREDHRRALESAYIGTIHGFCQRLLRENPIEAGVDPYFKVLSEGESDLLMARAMDAVFEDQAERPVWLRVLVESGESRVRSAMLRFYGQYRASGEDESLLALKDGGGRRELESRIEKDLLRMATSFGPKPKATELAILEAARRIPAAFRRPLDWAAFREVREAAGGVEKRMHKEWVEAFRGDVARWEPEALGELFRAEKEEFVRVFRAFRERYESEKRVRATFDFDDLPFLAWKTLSGETPEKMAVRARYRARFRHVFVDEFQDTSPLQAKLIDLLRGEGNLFIVGDPQQSIYAFRNADPSLFARYRDAAGKKIDLSENYRSRPAVLQFTNDFFVRPDGPFAPLSAARQFKLRGPGAVELSCSFYGESEPAADLDAAREIEAASLAARIGELVRSGTRVEDGTPGGRPMRWGDAAVLLRSTRKAILYERAFARAGVPFYSVKSRGFFERPEVKDFIAFLTLLDHPEDDVALAAVLRSPLGGVSDDGLFWLARHAKAADKDAPLSGALKSPAGVDGLSAADREKAEAFSGFADSLRSRKNRFTVSAILEEAVRWSAYECAALAAPSGEQRVANVRKLVAMARSLEEKTPVDSAEFVRYVRGLADRDEAEAEARIEGEGGDAVLLASIHAAKGLEFSCVAIANLGGRPPYRPPALVAASPEEGLGWTMPDPEDDANPFQDGAYSRVNEGLRRRNAEEADRLFYVAVTRAKERLILSGSAPRGRESETTWMSRALSFFGQGDEARPKEARAESGVAPALEQEPVPASGGVTAESVLARLRLPDKPYDLAADLTVSDLLPKASGWTVSEEPESVDAEDAERSPRNEFGTIFHRLMELGAAGSPRGPVKRETAERILAPLTAAEREEALAAAAAFWAGPWGKALRQSRQCYPELPFIFKTPHGILKGTLDLLYRGADGRWVVLDYKTNLIRAGQKAETAAGYELQLKLYAFVVRRLLGECPARGVLYFSALGDTHEFVYDEASLDAFEPEFLETFRETASAAPRAGA
ncbi:MAG TPA: UvrD-helicase domain-containing protein [Candidatus Eisenbacteria bacterium]|nr:UvrD-helicase domain-containing protein [Candidatus Eisenbacteria bacterium]